MMGKFQSQGILGQQTRSQYSPAFRRIMTRVVSKIYKQRTNKKPILTNIFTNHFSSKTDTDHTKMSIMQRTGRKNSPNSSKFFSLSKNSLGNCSDREVNCHQSMKLGCKTYSNHMNSRKNRCQTEYSSSIYISLHKKIDEYNQCLVTKTCKFQEKERHGLSHQSPEASERLPRDKDSFNLSIIKKCQNFKKYKKLVSFKNKICQSPSAPLRELLGLQPWQTDERDQHYF